jgi:hypothetical protein
MPSAYPGSVAIARTWTVFPAHASVTTNCDEFVRAEEPTVVVPLVPDHLGGLLPGVARHGERFPDAGPTAQDRARGRDERFAHG